MSKKDLVQFDEHGVFELDEETAAAIGAGAPGDRILETIRHLLHPQHNGVCLDRVCGNNHTCLDIGC